MRRLLVFLVAATSFAWPAAVSAQGVQRITAVVNDQVISVFDLEARIRLVIFSAQLQNTAQVRRRILRQVLRTLVDETLQIQEAKRHNVSASKRDIERATASIERRNRIPPGQLKQYLAEQGVPNQTLQNQIRANVAWSKLLRRRIRPRISISPDEVQEFIDRLKSRQGQPEYRIAEILLTIESARDLPQIQQSAERLVEQIRGGAPFRAVARQFSQNATAAAGGDLGWLHESELEDDLKTLVPIMSKGQVSNPIQTVAGIRIVTLLDRRRVAVADPTQVKLDLRQIFVPVAANLAPPDVEAKLEIARQVNGALKSCTDVPKVAQQVGSTRPHVLGKFSLTDLSPTVRKAVDTLKVGQASAPVRLSDGILILMVCDRIEPASRIPDQDQVSEMLMARRMALMSRRYMRDIRQAAVVDLRL